MISVSVNSNHTYEVEVENQRVRMENAPLDWEVSHIDQQRYLVIYQNTPYTIEIERFDPEDKQYELKVNGKMVQASIKDKIDLLLEKLGMHEGQSAKLKDVKAPMPGLILEVNVESGQEVKQGDTLLILEAMKMENALKSPADGIIQNVLVNNGESVDKNQVLIKF